ncbi:MAG: molybdopterin molybdotransferase MoeA [Clostridiales bacterium]|nr:molybdopterin molybdotransferase MoeA [Clostridiales bacterium]
MNLFEVHSIENAKKRILEEFSDLEIKTEKIAIMESLNRVSAQIVKSKINVPHFNRSTVDGYAVIAEDVQGTSESMPMMLEIVGESEMGKENKNIISNGECIYVPTGGMLPKGADSVVMIEYVEMFDEKSIAIYKPVGKKENTMSIGDDVRIDQEVMKKDQLIKSKDIGVLASIGIKEIEVYKKPNVILISTGDEIVDDVDDLKAGKILDINTYTIANLIKDSGGNAIKTHTVKDVYDDLKEIIISSMNEADLVIVSGGSSMGEKDNTAKIFDEIGDGVFIHGISIKPGKPTIVAKGNGIPLIGLPGQPVSAMIVYRVIVDFLLKNIFKTNGLIEKKEKRILDRNVFGAPGKDTYLMMKHYEESGNLYTTPVYGKSGMINLIAASTGYIIVDKDLEGYRKDEIIDFYYFV